MRTRSFVTNTAVVLGSQTLRYGLVFIAWALVGRCFGAEVLGKVQLAFIIPASATVFLGFGLPIANSYLLGKGCYPVSKILGNSLLWTLIGALLAVLILFCVRRYLIRFLPLESALYDAALAWIPLQMLYSNASSMLIGQLRFLDNGWATILNGLTMIVAVLVSAKVFRLGAAGLTVMLAIATGLAVLYQLWLYRGVARAKLAPSWRLMREAFDLGLRGYFGNIFQLLNYRFDTFIVAAFAGAAALGVYAVAYTLTELLWFVPQGIATVLMPVTAGSASETAKVRTSRLCRISMGISLVCGIVMALLSPWVVRWIFGSQFQRSVLLIWLLLPGVVAFVCTKILAADLGGRGHPEYASYAALGGLLLTILMNLLLVPNYGAVASAAISSVVYCLESAYLVLCYCKKVDVGPSDIVVPKRSDFIQLARWAYQRAFA